MPENGIGKPPELGIRNCLTVDDETRSWEREFGVVTLNTSFFRILGYRTVTTVRFWWNLIFGGASLPQDKNGVPNPVPAQKHCSKH